MLVCTDFKITLIKIASFCPQAMLKILLLKDVVDEAIPLRVGGKIG